MLLLATTHGIAKSCAIAPISIIQLLAYACANLKQKAAENLAAFFVA